MKTVWLGCGILMLLVLGSAPYAEALRCSNRIVSTGDAPAEVLAKCGAPTTQQQREEVIQVYHPILIGGRETFITRLLTIPVEVWTYNFGPHELIYELIFRDNRVTDIRTRGYGY